MVLRLTDEHTGLKVLWPTLGSGNKDGKETIDIVAVHGLGAHPDDTWTKNRGTKDEPQWMNWLQEEEMLPAAVPNARIMRFGYKSNWFGPDTIRHSPRTVADRLLTVLKQERESCVDRPLIFIAHSFGGLVVLKAVCEAYHDRDEWPGIFDAVRGLVFFGTPFRGADGMTHSEMVEAAAREYDEQDIEARPLEILAPDNELLQDLVDAFQKRVWPQMLQTRIACFYELQASEIGAIVGKQRRKTFAVNERSGCLDLSDRVSKYPLERTHFNMNKFARPEEVDYKIAAGVVRGIAAKAQQSSSAPTPPGTTRRLEYLPDDGADEPGMLSHRDHRMNKQYLVPHACSNKFTGRLGVLERLERSLVASSSPEKIAKRRIFVLHGLGGVGKTQISLRFAETYRRKFWGVFWIDASSVEAGDRSYADIGNAMGVKDGKLWLSNQQLDWLLILDNADDPSVDIAQFFPSGNSGALLVTSRNADCGIYATMPEMCHKLEDMELEDGMALILKTTGADRDDKQCRYWAEQIALKLDCLPLALMQAGAAIRQGRCKLQTYLDEYDQDHRRLLETHPGQGADGYKYTVYTAWEVSLRMMEEQNCPESSVARELLNVSAFLHPEDVPWHIFDHASILLEQGPHSKAASQYWGFARFLSFHKTFSRGSNQDYREAPVSDHSATQRTKKRISEAVSLLARYSLIDLNEENRTFTFHRLVHSWARDRLEGLDKQRARTMASLTLADSIPSGQDASDYQLRRRLYPHVNCIVGPDGSLFAVSSTDQVRMAEKYALVSSDGGNSAMAERMYKKSLLFLDTIWIWKDPIHRLTLVHKLSSVLRERGHFTKAAEMAQQAYQGRKESLGEDHRDSLDSLSSLVLALQGQGEYEEARRMSESLEKKCRRMLGSKSLETMAAMNTRALILQKQGKYDMAAVVCGKVLALREEVLTKEHPDTIESLSNLARILGYQGKWELAEERSRQAYKRREKTLGKEHPDTLASKGDLASVMLEAGHDGEAERMYREVLESRRKVLGPEHPDTMTSYCDLAAAVRQQGDFAKAEEMLRLALVGYRKHLKESHPYILVAQSNLAINLRSRQKFKDALDMYEKTLAVWEETKQQHHPEALACLGNLIVALREQKRYTEAEDAGKRALAGYQKTLGCDHHSTLWSLADLGWTLQFKERYVEAEEMIRTALGGLISQLGIEKPTTLDVVCRLAYILERCSKHEEAWLLYDEACKQNRSLGGANLDHWCFKRLKRLEETMKAASIPQPSSSGFDSFFASTAGAGRQERESRPDLKELPSNGDSRKRRRSLSVDEASKPKRLQV